MIKNEVLMCRLNVLAIYITFPFNPMRPTKDLASTLSYGNDFETFTKHNVTEDMELALLEGVLSSTIVLTVVLTIIFTLVVMSLLTYCFHKWKLKIKKLHRAQEEYQRDQEKVMSPCTS